MIYITLHYTHIETPLGSTVHPITGRGVARSKYVGWTDMASAECEPITGVWRRSNPPAQPLPCKNSSDLYQFQERPVAKAGWTCPPRGDAADNGTQSMICLGSSRLRFHALHPPAQIVYSSTVLVRGVYTLQPVAQPVVQPVG